MILGIGNDLVEIKRIEHSLRKYGQRFIDRLFTDVEREKAAQRHNPAPTYAKRFAAKEACAKALGTGMSRGVFFRDLGVVNDPSGKPTMQLTGGALERLMEMKPKDREIRIHLSITDEHDWAQAFVIIEAI